MRHKRDLRANRIGIGLLWTQRHKNPVSEDYCSSQFMRTAVCLHVPRISRRIKAEVTAILRRKTKLLETENLRKHFWERNLNYFDSILLKIHGLRHININNINPYMQIAFLMSDVTMNTKMSDLNTSRKELSRNL